MSRTTMADVAAHAGVTVATVSRSLNERTARLQSPATVARVRASADALGYRHDVLARGLRTRRSNTIGMLVPDVTNPFMPPLVRAVEDAVQRAGFSLILTNTDNDVGRERVAQRMLSDHRVDAAVLATARLGDDWGIDELRGDVPVVLVNRRSRLELPTVAPDDAQAVALVVDHLTALGHRRLAQIAAPLDISTGSARAEAFARHAAARRLDVETEVAAGITVEDGDAACRRLLHRAPQTTAVFAGNDLLAIGCVIALEAEGRGVPRDASVIGFNDMPLAGRLDPPLTTVHLPRYEMGRRAGELVVSLLEKPPGDGPPPLIELPGELVVRRSTGPAPR